MEIGTTTKDRSLTVTLHGELDHHAARGTMREIEHALDAALPLQLVLDFTGVAFMDSSGIAVVLRAQRRMQALGGRLEVRGVQAQVKKVFEAAGIHHLIPIR